MTTFIPYETLTKNPKIYLIHDNGGRPFQVVASSFGIDIYTYSDDDLYSDRDAVYDVLLLHIPSFIGYWPGFDSSYYAMHGNSILIQKTPHTYIEVGWNIYRFTTTEPILEYISPVGNSDVPYPVAYSKNYVYFMLDQQYMPRYQLYTEATVENAETIYQEFYGIKKSKLVEKKVMKNVHVLVKRKL
jgi:hypothetical protein